MRHYIVSVDFYKYESHQFISGWSDEPVAAFSKSDVMHCAIKKEMELRDLTPTNSNIYENENNVHIVFWDGSYECACMVEIRVDETVVWDDLDLDELSPEARAVIEQTDQSLEYMLMECSTIEDVEEVCKAYHD